MNLECPHCWRVDSHSLACYFAHNPAKRPQGANPCHPTGAPKSAVSAPSITGTCDPQKALHRDARQAVAKALRRGGITRPAACSQCEKGGQLHAHHDDYSRPLTVRWLCEACHLEHHGKTAPVVEGWLSHIRRQPGRPALPEAQRRQKARDRVRAYRARRKEQSSAAA